MFVTSSLPVPVFCVDSFEAFISTLFLASWLLFKFFVSLSFILTSSRLFSLGTMNSGYVLVSVFIFKIYLLKNIISFLIFKRYNKKL